MILHENRLPDNSHEIICFVIFEKAAKFEIAACCKLQVALYGLNALQNTFIMEPNTMTPDKNVYWKIIFLISQPKHLLWVLKRTVSSYEHPKHMFKFMGKEINTLGAQTILIWAYDTDLVSALFAIRATNYM